MTEVIFSDRPTFDEIKYAELTNALIIIRIPVNERATKEQICKRAKAVLEEIGHPYGHNNIMACIDIERDQHAFRKKVINGLREYE